MRGIMGLSVVLLLLMPCAATSDAAESMAERILAHSGVHGGLIVHLNCGDGQLTATMGAEDHYVVQGLEADREQVEQARRHVRKSGAYGRVSIRHWNGGDRLPYADHLVNLLVVSGDSPVDRAELLRVLCPGGAAVFLNDDEGRITEDRLVKPWPAEIDQWTHYLRGPDNNAVAQDTIVGPPRHLQWRCGPLWMRSHDHLSSFSAMVSAGGRVFYIVDEAPVASVAFPSQWRLVARDAFSGVKLWTRNIPTWESRFRGFRSGPPELARRLVAIDDRVYVTLGYGQPISVLDAASGQTAQVFETTVGAEEILVEGGTLYAVLGGEQGGDAADRAQRRGDAVVASRSVVAACAETGRVLWTVTGDRAGYVMPTTLAVADGGVFFQNANDVVCLDAQSGEERWRSARPIIRRRPTWLAPTLVVQDGVVLSADRNASWIQTVGLVDQQAVEPDRVEWDEDSREAYRPFTEAKLGRPRALQEMTGTLDAFCAQTGKRLWSGPVSETFNAPPDVLVSDGLVWTSRIVCASQPGITEGRNLRTGEVEFTRSPDQEFYTVGMGHGRCHRSFGTSSYLITGRAGIEFVDLESGEGIANHWLRGACQFGFMPANGLLYVPPHPCACYIEAKINAMNAMAPARDDAPPLAAGQLQNEWVQGPAFDDVPEVESSPADWPTYRQDAARSGRATSAVPPELKTLWQVSLDGPLSSPVVADGRLFVASVDAHTVSAFEAVTGQPSWIFTAGGRVDSPPTIWRGKVLFGSADGSVYCLRASDGQLVWRFQAAPENRQIVNMDQLESAWPVHGNVLVQDGAVYFVAGRSSYVDGGMHLYGLDAKTGERIFHRHLFDFDPQTQSEARKQIRGTGGLPGVLPDILSSDGDSLFMRHQRYDLMGQEQPTDVPHLYSAVGFLDDEWWNRTYWIFGTETGSGFGGWARPGRRAPAGRLLVRDGADIYGFGRNVYQPHGPGGGSHVGLGGIHYELFATRIEDRGHSPQWTTRLPFWVRGMVLDSQRRLFVAGPPVEQYVSTGPIEDVSDPDVVGRDQLGPWYGEYYLSVRSPEEALAAYLGKRGAKLWVVSGDDGERMAEFALDSPPVFDGMIAAAGRLYITTEDGQILCLGDNGRRKGDRHQIWER